MRSLVACLAGGFAFVCAVTAGADPLQRIEIDGQFDDWQYVPVHSDFEDDTHDTDHSGPDDVPLYVKHPDVDLLAFKMAHDEENLYAYFRAAGAIGRTQSAAEGRAGRYYAIVTIDVDNNIDTGYWLHEGGYYPTSGGYDMNMEVEFYDGAFNTGHYLNHGCLDELEFFAAQADQSVGIVDVKPGTYDWYTQWVWWDTPQGYDNEIVLPGGQGIVWVEDRGPVYQGIIRIAVSPDGHEAEMVAPFRGFMKYPNGAPIVTLGRTINASFSLEASGELAPGGEWASDTGPTIYGYFLDSAPLTYMLTTAVKGEGGVSPVAGDHAYERDTSVMVAATPAPGWYFSHWENSATGSANPVEVLMDRSKAVTAVFMHKADIDESATVDAVDVQLVINSALGLEDRYDCDVSGDAKVDAVDVQTVINAALGLAR